MLESVVETYDEALRQLAELPFDASGSVLEPGWSELTPPVLQPMHGFGPTLLDEVLRFNRSSCAISNFPDEHTPGPAVAINERVNGLKLVMAGGHSDKRVEFLLFVHEFFPPCQ